MVPCGSALLRSTPQCIIQVPLLVFCLLPCSGEKSARQNCTEDDPENNGGQEAAADK